MKKYIILLALMLNLVPHFNDKGSLTFGPSIVKAGYGDEDGDSEEDDGNSNNDSYDNSSNDNSSDDSSTDNSTYDNSNDNSNYLENLIDQILTDGDDYADGHYQLDVNDDGSVDIYSVDDDGNKDYIGSVDDNGDFIDDGSDDPNDNSNFDNSDDNTSDPDEQCDDACLPSCSNYSIEICDIQNCDPGSNNWDPAYCEESNCDPYSVNYDPGYCDESNCDPESVNYDEEYCEESNCDPWSSNYDEKYCESLCDPKSSDFNQDACDASNCIEGSPNFDPEYCDESNCNPESINYDPAYCKSNKELMDKSKWVGYGGSSCDCFCTALKILANYGITSVSGCKDSYRIMSQSSNGTLNNLGNQYFTNAIDAIDRHLDEGDPILAGVDIGDEKNYYNDKAADHWIVITGRGYDLDKAQFYYTYMETGRTNDAAGTHQVSACSTTDNRLYLNSTNNTLVDPSNYNNLKYTVTEIRPVDGDTSDTESGCTGDIQ